MKIAIGSDKSGFNLKEAIKAHLIAKGHQVDDLGTLDTKFAKPYVEVAQVVAQETASGVYERSILCCGTGMGMAIAANKFNKVYAAVCESLYTVKMCRAINNANILTMGGWTVTPEIGVEMADVFINTEFGEGLEDWRKEFISKSFGRLKKEIEGSNFR